MFRYRIGVLWVGILEMVCKGYYLQGTGGQHRDGVPAKPAAPVIPAMSWIPAEFSPKFRVGGKESKSRVSCNLAKKGTELFPDVWATWNREVYTEA